MFGSYSFLIYMLIFTLIPIAILWSKNYAFLSKNRKIILSVVLLGLVFQLIGDPFAEAWNAWYYTREKTLCIWFGSVPIENTIFTILIAVVISSAVLSFIHYHEKKLLKK